MTTQERHELEIDAVGSLRDRCRWLHRKYLQ